MRQFRPTYVSDPPKAHPLVRLLFKRMHEEQIGLCDMEARSGVSRATIRSWRTKNAPSLANIEACLNVVGVEIVAVEAFRVAEGSRTATSYLDRAFVPGLGDPLMTRSEEGSYPTVLRRSKSKVVHSTTEG